MCYNPKVVVLGHRAKSPLGEKRAATIGPLTLPDYQLKGSEKNFILTDCGICPECLMKRRQNQISALITYNLFKKQSMYMLTLTYNEEHKRLTAGQVLRDLQLFHKRLNIHFKRKNLTDKDNPIKYKARTHRGTKGRLHAHGVYINIPLTDLVEHEYTPNGILYRSDTIASLWGKGFITIIKCDNENSLRYALRYSLRTTDFTEKKARNKRHRQILEVFRTYTTPSSLAQQLAYYYTPGEIIPTSLAEYRKDYLLNRDTDLFISSTKLFDPAIEQLFNNPVLSDKASWQGYTIPDYAINYYYNRYLNTQKIIDTSKPITKIGIYETQTVPLLTEYKLPNKHITHILFYLQNQRQRARQFFQELGERAIEYASQSLYTFQETFRKKHRSSQQAEINYSRMRSKESL